MDTFVVETCNNSYDFNFIQLPKLPSRLTRLLFCSSIWATPEGNCGAHFTHPDLKVFMTSNLKKIDFTLSNLEYFYLKVTRLDYAISPDELMKHLSTTSPNLRFIEIDWLHSGEFNIRSFMSSMDSLLKLERAKFIFRGRNYPTLLDFDASGVRRFKEFHWESYIYNPIYTIAQEDQEAPKPRKNRKRKK